MKRTVSYFFAAVLLASMLICLDGCGKYSSKYRAVGFIHSNESDSAFMNFYEFTGRMVFRLNNKTGGNLKCYAKLEDGEAEIFYDSEGEKTSLCAVHSGDEFKIDSPNLKKGIIYIIAETDAKCKNGEFKFEIG